MPGLGDILKYAGQGMGLAAAPATGGASLLPSLIEGGAGLLGALLSGKGKQKEREQAEADRQRKIQELTQKFKPSTGYYSMGQSLPQLDYIIKKAVLGNLQGRLGEGTMGQWGLDLGDILKQMGMSGPAPSSNPMMSRLPADVILEKYNMKRPIPQSTGGY